MSKRKQYTDQQLIELLEAGGKQLEQGMTYLYHDSGYRKDILQFLRKKGKNLISAEDIFQEGICRLIMNIRTRKFKQQSSLKTYLTGICQNIWLNQSKAPHQQELLPLHLAKDASFPTQNKPSIELDNLLAKIKSDCRSVLSLWALSYSMEEIALELGYKNGNVASKKKHLCLKKLKRMIQTNYKLANQWIKEG